MLSSMLAISLGTVVANGLAVRSSCSVQFTVDGAISGDVGQISSGQVRAGQGISSDTFTISGSEITDSEGRGCWWTPPSEVLQCDPNQKPDDGFEIGCDGQVSYNGQTDFWECETDQPGQYNIYLKPDGVNCQMVTLHAGGCYTGCPTPAPSPTPSPPSPPQQTCPKDLSGTYEFPHLIIPVDSSQPDTASGTSLFGVISSTVSSIFNFDIPSEDKGKTCSLVFLFPEKADLETSDYDFSGGGGVSFSSLDSPAMSSTTYNNRPGVKEDLGTFTLAPGNGYSVATFECPAGDAIAFEIMAEGDTYLRYFQDYNPSPIGLYITVC